MQYHSKPYWRAILLFIDWLCCSTDYFHMHSTSIVAGDKSWTEHFRMNWGNHETFVALIIVVEYNPWSTTLCHVYCVMFTVDLVFFCIPDNYIYRWADNDFSSHVACFFVSSVFLCTLVHLLTSANSCQQPYTYVICAMSNLQ